MNIQFKQGVIEFCILTLLHNKKLSGYHIEKTLSSRFRIPEGSIYPLLRKMVKEGYLETLYENEAGKNKKYFSITPLGQEEKNKLNNQWNSLTTRVNQLIEEG